MIVQQLRKHGNSYALTVPKEEVDRRGWQEGQHLGFDPVEVEIEIRTKMRPQVQEAFDATWDEDEAAMRYLADR
jgi:antitoxin component of MazEF toxin-antitoxin module